MWDTSIEPNGTPAPRTTKGGGRPTYLLPFYPGDGRDAILLTVTDYSEFPRDRDNLCAFCHGDPCAERSGVETLIGNYGARMGRWFETCPCCNGRPS